VLSFLSESTGGFGLKRRAFISLLGGAAAAWPLMARAQQSAMPTIGFLGGASPELYVDRLTAFRQGLQEAGYVEGQNAQVEYLWAEGHPDRLPALATQLVRRQVAVIVAGGGTPSAWAAKAATATIPIVFGVAIDPVQLGLVASLNRPGGNLTGVTNMNVDVGPKRLELLREVLPSASVISVLVNPTSAAITEPYLRDLEAAAQTLDFGKPVAIMLLGILNFVPDDDEAQKIVERLVAAVPSGSYLVMSHPTLEVHREATERAMQMWNSSGSAQIVARDPQRLAGFFNGLRILDPGLVTCSQWRPDGNDTTPVTEYCAVGIKP